MMNKFSAVDSGWPVADQGSPLTAQVTFVNA
jgi:hypothetical protein